MKLLKVKAISIYSLIKNICTMKKTADVQSKGGGATVPLKDNNFMVVVSGTSYDGLKDVEDKDLVDTPNYILSHELVGHAIPDMIGSDTGNAVENENKVREETNSKQRKENKNHVE
jgi:hypothetical protein